MIDPNLITTERVGELPTEAFSLTDNIPHEVGADLKKGTIQEFIDFLTPFLTAIQFQVIALHVNSAYIADNFDGTGLGTNLMLGYAICNGNNGTINKDGRVGVAYGSTYNAIGFIDGSSTHTLTVNEMPVHSHTISNQSNGVSGGGKVTVGNEAPEGTNPVTDTAGGGASHNNMQPYIVELHVMKL